MLVNTFGKAVSVMDGRVTVHDESALASPAMDKLVYTAVFGEPDEEQAATRGRNVFAAALRLAGIDANVGPVTVSTYDPLAP